MKRKCLIWTIVIFLSAVAGTGPGRAAAGTDQVLDGSKIVVGYFPAWGIYYDYRVKDIDASKLTHINYAFINVRDNRPVVGVTQSGVADAWADYQRSFSAAESVDGTADTWNQPLKGNWNQIKKLKNENPHVKVLAALGGWTWSGGFSDAALPENREAFVAACIDALILGNLPYDPGSNTGGPGAAAGVFDGIDIDWEYPVCCGLGGNTYRPEDKQNYTALLAEFRRQLDAINPALLLTIAGPAGPHNVANHELGQFPQYVDFINLMAYDFHGSWDSYTGHLAAMYPASDDPYAQAGWSMHEAVQTYLDQGIPASQLVLGLPFYGRSWTGVSPGPNGDGLYQSAGGAGPGEREEPGMLNYYTIKQTYEPAYTKYSHPEAGVPWLYNGNNFITYDDPAAITRKAGYILQQDLAGAMCWNLMSDVRGNPAPPDSLLSTLWEGLGGVVPQYACSDGIDNDGDGLIDMDDPGCMNDQDNDEYDPPPVQCNDGIDNDGDGLIDLDDPGCMNDQDNDEYNPSDPGDVTAEVSIQSDWGTGYCANVQVTNRSSQSVAWVVSIEVEGTIQNLWNGLYTLKDGLVEVQGASWNAQVGPGASTSFGFCADRDQPPEPLPACSDGVDNDGDGLIDMDDPGCENESDDDEWNVPPSGDLDVELLMQSDWGTGYCADILIRNNGQEDVDWTVTMDIEGRTTTLWGAQYEEEDGTLTLEGLSWNNMVPAGGTVPSVGFCAQR